MSGVRWKPVLTFLTTCASCVLLLFLPPDLPDPVVEISPDPVPATAGGDLVLTCTVTVEEHLVAQPTVEWSGGSVGSESVSVDDIMRDGAISTRQITFSPLRTSHGGQYECQADIDIPSIGLMRTASSSRDVTAQSEWLYITFCQSTLSLHAHMPTQSPVQWWLSLECLVAQSMCLAPPSPSTAPSSLRGWGMWTHPPLSCPVGMLLAVSMTEPIQPMPPVWPWT